MSPLSRTLGLLAAVLATSAHAEALTFDQALARATINAPGLQAAGLRVEAARAASRAAGVLPDPQVKFGVENYPISGPMAGRYGADEMTMATVGVMQEIPNRARRAAEQKAAQADIGSAQAQATIAEREARLGAALAWIDLYYAQKRLDALDDILSALRPLWDAAPAGVASGGGRPASALAPIRMRAALSDQRSEIDAAFGRAQAQLVRWTGDPSPSIVGEPPDLHRDLDALRAGFESHPTLLAYRAADQRAQADIDLARSAKRPDWSVEVGYGRRDPMFGDMVSAGVTVRLPIFTGRRQDPIIAARTADAARIQAERVVAGRTLVASLEGDIADHVMHHDQWIRAVETVLPAARQQADLETASYAAGRASLADVLEAFAALADARVTALEREAAVARDAVRITFTYGSQTP